MNNTTPQDAAAPVSEVPHREFDFEAWMEANTYSRDSAPNGCYYVKESAVRELWDRQQRAPQPLPVAARVEAVAWPILLYRIRNDLLTACDFIRSSSQSKAVADRFVDYCHRLSELLASPPIQPDEATAKALKDAIMNLELAAEQEDIDADYEARSGEPSAAEASRKIAERYRQHIVTLTELQAALAQGGG